MDKHCGQIVEYIVRKNGFSITDLATETCVNRRSIYNWFAQRNLRADIIYRIGCAIRHDFSKEFPELFTGEDFKEIYKVRQPYSSNTHVNENEDWKYKYIILLEKYNKMLLRREIIK